MGRLRPGEPATDFSTVVRASVHASEATRERAELLGRCAVVLLADSRIMAAMVKKPRVDDPDADRDA